VWTTIHWRRRTFESVGVTSLSNRLARMAGDDEGGGSGGDDDDAGGGGGGGDGGGLYAEWPDQWPNRQLGDKFVLHEGMQMPPEYKRALTADYAGQHFGDKHLFLLRRFFDAKVILKPKGYFDSAPILKKSVSTKLTCKFDDSINYEHGYDKINPGKFYKPIFASHVVPDEEKRVLAQKSNTREGAQWLAKYEAKEELACQSNSQTGALDAAERHLLVELRPVQTHLISAQIRPDEHRDALDPAERV
jgi:hypothetical protein